MTNCTYCSLLCEFTDSQPLDCPLRNRCLARQLRAELQPTAAIDGRAVTVDQAIDLANEMLASRKPKNMTGHIRSVEGSRAVLALASRISAFVDPTQSADAFKSIRAIQRSGMMTASMSEVRFRSDCLALIGNDQVLDACPRLLDVLQRRSDDRPADSPIRIVALGNWSQAGLARLRQYGSEVSSIQIEVERIPQSLFQWSRCGTDQHTRSPNMVSQWLAQARYLTLVWCPAQLHMPHADLWIERLNQWIEERNGEFRCVGFPLTSDYVTFQQVCTWSTGFPGRVAFDGPVIRYEPNRDPAPSDRQNADGTITIQVDEALDDSLLAADFTPATIVIAPCLDPQLPVPRVFIRCAVPGVEHRATFFRVDATVAVETLDRPSTLVNGPAPPVSAILAQLGMLPSC